MVHQPKRGEQIPSRGETKKARVGKASADKGPQLSQREKFIQTARELECDETGEKLDEALRTIGRARRR
jgi:hypothetical protein